MILLGLGAVHCRSIEIPNINAHVPLADGGAFTRYLNTETEGYVDPQEWPVKQIGFICVSPDDFADVVRVFERICNRRDDACTQEQEEKLRAMQYRLTDAL